VLHDTPVGHATDAERAFLAEVQGGCQVPMGAWARLTDDETLTIDACIAALDGSEHYRGRRSCAPDDGPIEARSLAQALLADGGAEVLDRILEDKVNRASPFRP
jgi:hydroxymethylbilane synthase